MTAPWHPGDGEGDLADPAAWADAPLLPLGSRYHHPELALIPGGGLSRREKGFLLSKVQDTEGNKLEEKVPSGKGRTLGLKEFSHPCHHPAR